MNAIATTFRVSQVKPATTALPEVSYQESVETLLTARMSDIDRESIIRYGIEGSPDDIPDPTPFRPVEACSRYHGRLVGQVEYHPVVAAVDHAFRDHRPLRLSPDMIWLMICQGVANHVNFHAEELRHRFVTHEGKVQISVQRNDFVKGSSENPWGELIDEFCRQVREHVGPSIDLFVSDFSTTGPAERVASEVVLLDAVESYFSYFVGTKCGIPEISLEGTTNDWESLARRTEGFEEFGLKPWVEALRPILNQFVRASSGDVDADFWKSLYKLHSQSGGVVITGWLTTFFPYSKDRNGRATFPVRELLVEGYVVEQEREGFARGPTTGCLPGGLSRAPFRWDYLDQTYHMELLGGFVGVAQDPETLALRPEIGWAVRETSPAPPAG